MYYHLYLNIFYYNIIINKKIYLYNYNSYNNILIVIISIII